MIESKVAMGIILGARLVAEQRAAPDAVVKNPGRVVLERRSTNSRM
jgi:hypothetical protein